MKNTTIRKAIQLALVAAIAGTFTVSPAGAQETPATPVANPNDIIRGLNKVQGELDKLVAKGPEKPGSGTAHARYTLDGWTFTAVAYNPKADRLYAISTGQDGKPAGHLLRMQPNNPINPKVADLGELRLDGMKTERIASAAVTSRGHLVLFADDQFRVFDLSTDVVKDKVKDISTVAATPGRLKVDPTVGNVGFPSAWASTGVNQDALYAVSRDPEGAPYQWTLSLRDGAVSITPLPVAPGLDLAPIGALNYAYTKDESTFVFADDEGRSIEVRDGKVIATYFGGTPEDNLREVSYLSKGNNARPVSVTEKPAPAPAPRGDLAAEPAPAERPALPLPPAAPAPAPAPDAGLPTVVAPETEPTQHTQPGETETAAAEREVKITAIGENGTARRGVEVSNPYTGETDTTDREGEARLTVAGGDAVVVVDQQAHVVPSDVLNYRVTLHADAVSNASLANETTTASDTVVAARTIPVMVYDENDTPIPNATVTGPEREGATTATARTNANGLAMLPLPEMKAGETVSIRAEYDGAERQVQVTGRDQSATAKLDVRVASQSPSRSSATNRPTTTLTVTVRTEGGSPVQYAEVYSVDALGIRVDGLTNEYGQVRVTIPGDVGNGDDVRLGVRSAPSGYKTVERRVNRYEDGVTLTLPKGSTTTSTTSTKSTPQEILEVIDELEPLLKALGGTAAISKVTRSATTATNATGTATATSLNNTVMTGRSTTAPNATRAQANNRVAATSTSRATRSDRDDDRDDDLADTGTPMTAVMTLGVLAMLIGGVYVAMGRRRES